MLHRQVKKAAATSPSLKRGSRPNFVRLQSKKLKGEETRNREDGQKKAIFTEKEDPHLDQ